jgi:hypothetical protein
MRGLQYDRILTNMTLALMLAAPLAAFAQDSDEPSATFNERFPADQVSKQSPLDPEAKKEQKGTKPLRIVGAKHSRSRVASAKHSRSRVVVRPRSFLDGGTEVLSGERKFLDYAFPPTHVTLDVVTNTGGRVGGHNSPLPGPFFIR